MTAQEILERITVHRANVVQLSDFDADLERKIHEIEWGLQALAEKLVDMETK
jgi:hypothetical protein